MAHYQPIPSTANTQTTETKVLLPTLRLHQFDAVEALYKGEISVTLSELLGCDYVFIQHPAKTLLIHDRHLTETLNQLIQVLGLAPRQKVFIGLHEGAQGSLRFYRFQCEWQGTQATQVTRTAVTDSEQISFLQMIFDCSSPYVKNSR